MIYVYFFIRCVVRWSENSVRFIKSYGNWLPDGPNSVRFYIRHMVHYHTGFEKHDPCTSRKYKISPVENVLHA